MDEFDKYPNEAKYASMYFSVLLISEQVEISNSIDPILLKST